MGKNEFEIAWHVPNEEEAEKIRQLEGNIIVIDITQEMIDEDFGKKKETLKKLCPDCFEIDTIELDSVGLTEEDREKCPIHEKEWFRRKEHMLNIYCPHCYEPHRIIFNRGYGHYNATYKWNPELGVKDAITGRSQCSNCGKTIWFDLYPPYTRNPYGALLEIYKKNRCE